MLLNFTDDTVTDVEVEPGSLAEVDAATSVQEPSGFYYFCCIFPSLEGKVVLLWCVVDIHVCGVQLMT